MMYSTTFRQYGVANRTLEALADTIARAFVQLQSLFTPVQASPAEARAELLRLADTYESSQPSYAADLRAAASRY